MTPKEVQKEYGITPDARRSFVHRHKIPTKTEFGKLFYSKDHIDKVKGFCFDDRDKYYSVGEAMSAYNMSKDRVFYYTKVHIKYEKRKNVAITLSIKVLKGLLEVA